MFEYIGLTVNGILLGSFYAIIGIGLSMVFGIMKQVNLTHGALIILSSYVGLLFIRLFGLHPLLTLLLVFPTMFIFGYLIQVSILNRVMGQRMESYLIISFGLSVILESVLILIFTPDAQSLESSLTVQSFNVHNLFHVPVIYLVNLAAAVLVFGLLQYLMKRTYLGWAIKSLADDLYTARLMGINPRKVYALAMAIATGTAAIAGVLLGMTFTFYPHSGAKYLIIAFGVVVIGGLGSLPGTFLGGIILAISQLAGGHIFGPGLQLLTGYLVLIVLLTLRPQGIFRKG